MIRALRALMSSRAPELQMQRHNRSTFWLLASCAVMSAACSDPSGPDGDAEVTWIGWSRTNTILLDLDVSGTRASGSATIVSLPFTFAIDGSVRDDSLSFTMTAAGAPRLEFRGERSQTAIRGILNGGGLRDDTATFRPRTSDPNAGPPWIRLTIPTGFQPNGIAVIDGTWFITSQGGLLRSTNTGVSWTSTLLAGDPARITSANALAVHPSNRQSLALGHRSSVFVSADGGATWTLRKTLPEPVASVHISGDGTIWVGLWPDFADPESGLHRLRPGGDDFFSFGSRSGERLIPWDIAENSTGELFVATEIADHPQPYQPPLLSSRDGGRTWIDNAGSVLFWHSREVEHDGQCLTILLEGAGVFRRCSGDWEYRSRVAGVSLAQRGATIVVAQPHLQSVAGGVYISTDGGWIFEPFGLAGEDVIDVALTADNRAVAVTQNGGLYVRALPR